MPVNRLYYHVKPYLPWRFRMAARRMLARRTREAFRETWPINETAARPPESWTGWPDGKQFAFVLTHDIEGPAGLAKCRQLMQLDKKLGLRSSFNFIPEGDYAVSAELRAELTQNGFEVGVHDLHHNGQLFWSRRVFSESAKWINHYLKEWGATGFRSGFMLRNLDWLHELDIRYDASTFDTDPFEPQPDGVGTIFPFWISCGAAGRPKSDVCSSQFNARATSLEFGNRRSVPSSDFHVPSFDLGYVELPYTLVQDSTLFLVLREPTPEIWLRKLDWIAEHGGMALINVHPDYLRFPGEQASSRTFPVAHYIQLLQYLKHRYAGAYWQPLPREMAEFCLAVRPVRSSRARRRVCMINYSVYCRDNRVIRYAEALAERGDEVDVMALKGERSQPSAEKVGSVQVYPIAGRYKKTQETHGQYLLPLLRFWAAASLRLAWKHSRCRYDLIHVHNMPDFLVFAAWCPRFMGAKVILDVHDIMPEFYATKFQVKKGDRAFGVRLLKRIERVSARFANHVIISNHLWLKPFVTRAIPESKCSVFINFVNRNLFYRRRHAGNGDKRIIMFPGGLQWHQGLDICIRAMPAVLKRIRNAEFHIYGDGNMKAKLVALTRELGLAETVRFFDPLPVLEIADVMSRADLGVVPKRADSFGNEAYSTKIMEFMSLGVPVVVSNTKIDRFYFNDSVVRFFESGNSEALAEAIIEVLQNDVLRQEMIAKGLEYAEQNSWDRRKNDYLELVDSLIENRLARFSGSGPGASTCRRSGVENRAADAETEQLVVK